MVRESPDYLSYLLRLWRVRDDEESTWRAWIKSSQDGEQLGFASLDALFDYLRCELGMEPGAHDEESSAILPT